VKTKVLLVSHIGLPWGGVSQRYSDLLKSSLSEKVDLTFFESSPNKQSISGTGILNIQNTIGFFDVCVKYILELIQVKPLIVHIASAFGYSFLKNSILIIIAKIFGYKVILAPHCSISVFIPESKLFFLWMKFVLNRCDGLLVLSNEWLDIQAIAPKTRVMLLKNSINLRDYIELKRTMGKQSEKVKIVYLGHIGVAKGIMDLIQAVDVVQRKGRKEFKVVIYGEELRSGELDYSKQMVKNLRLDDVICFSEPVFGDEKVEAFRDADIFILPSHHEGLPISIIEAMASGLPVIGTNIGGIPDLVENSKNGLLVNSKAPQCLATAMITLIENQQLRFSFGLEGRKKALENHDVENYVDRLIAFYQEI
jgi:glycosyltransferase involved in cell wall biosynthesis